MNNTYADFDSAGAPDFTHSHEAFAWNGGAAGFTGRLSLMQGFTGEHSDGEVQQFAIRGKSGQVIWFDIVDAVLCDDDFVDYWIVQPSDRSKLALVGTGRILND